MMMPAPVAALTTPLYKLATSARLRCRLPDIPCRGALLPAEPPAAETLLLLAALPAIACSIDGVPAGFIYNTKSPRFKV